MNTMKVAEYRMERNHREHLLDIVEFQGIIEVPATRPTLNIDMNEIARMQAEREAKLETGSFWS